MPAPTSRRGRRLGRSSTMIGRGSAASVLGRDDVAALLAQAFDTQPLDGKRVLVIVPDGTRTAPIPLFFELLYQAIGGPPARPGLPTPPRPPPPHMAQRHLPPARA